MEEQQRREQEVAKEKRQREREVEQQRKNAGTDGPADETGKRPVRESADHRLRTSHSWTRGEILKANRDR